MSYTTKAEGQESTLEYRLFFGATSYSYLIVCTIFRLMNDLYMLCEYTSFMAHLHLQDR
jgi:hypothetical protein